MIEYMSKIDLSLGKAADAASATGSLNAKVAEVLARLGTTGPALVQYGSVLLNAATTNTATITSVDTTKSTIVWLGAASGGTTINTDFGRLALTNATTVTATSAANGNTLTIAFAVVTWTAPILVQRATIVISGAGSNTATITSVTTTRAVLYWLGNTLNTGSVLNQAQTRITLTNATTVTATKVGISNDTTVSFDIVSY